MTGRKRISMAAIADKNWLNTLLLPNLKGCSFDKEEIKDRLMAEVEHAIDEKLQEITDGQGLGIVFRLEVLMHDGRVEGSPRDMRNDPLLKEWRQSVIKRDGYTCTECGSKDNLQAHHIKEWATHPDLRLDVENGQTLCIDCHALKHPQQEGLIRNHAKA